MKKKIEKVLEEIAVDTFEDICFMYPMPELGDSQKKMKREATVEVKYIGNRSGSLRIETRGALLSAVSANILGIEASVSKNKKDALGEIANIICGNIVPYLGRGTKGYKIEAPRILRQNQLAQKKKNPLCEISLNFEEGRADITLFVDEAGPAREMKD